MQVNDIRQSLGRMEGKVDQIATGQAEIREDVRSLQENVGQLNVDTAVNRSKTSLVTSMIALCSSVAVGCVAWFTRHV